MTDNVTAAADVIQSRGVNGAEILFVLPAGLGNMTDTVENPVAIPYADLPGFPATQRTGNDGQLLFGTQEGLPVAYMLGRANYFNTGRPNCMQDPLETLAMAGVQMVVLVAGGGSCNADILPGNLMLVTDHINLNCANPLVGSGGEGGLVPMVDAYDPRLNRRFKRATLSSGVSLREGVMMWTSGPTFETPAEIKVARLLGVDMTTMSIAPEIMLARRLGLRAAGILITTSFGAGFQGGNPSYSETRQTAAQGAISLKRLIRGFLKTKEIETK